MTGDPADDVDLSALVDRLLVRDAGAHAEAIDAIAERGDERVIPHLVELVVIDAIANDWARFGFPEILRERDPPRYLELPEVQWPGVGDALAAIAEPNFDSEYTWVEWESWYSQQEIEPLPGFDEWKLRLFRSYLPPVGSLLAVEPRSFDLQDVRWGNCDRSSLAALNAPDFVDVDDVSDGFPDPDDVVFGFEVDGTPYAVPRTILFPHELTNAEIAGVPVSLTFCTQCNAPILYDRRVGDRTLTFGNTGLLLGGNKVMYDEETESLWNQHAGVPLAGPHLDRNPDLTLDQRAVTQTTWGQWRDAHTGTLVLDPDTGYGYDYTYYEGNLGIFRHYWEREDVIQTGVRREEGPVPEKASCYGIPGADGDEVWVIPLDDVSAEEVHAASIDGREVVVLRDDAGDVAVYEAPPTPVERDASGLVDADGERWSVERDALHDATEGGTLDRIVGRHGLFFAFRTRYGEAHVVDLGADRATD